MSEVERIADQLERAYKGEAWHGPSLHDVLNGVDVDAASARPLPDAHTIRELAAHVLAWEKECLARLAGGGKDLPPEEDWPEGDAAWRDLLEELDTVHGHLVEAVSTLSDEELERSVPVGMDGTTVYILLHGVIQHNLYHAGQMALLKKAL